MDDLSIMRIFSSGGAPRAELAADEQMATIFPPKWAWQTFGMIIYLGGQKDIALWSTRTAFIEEGMYMQKMQWERVLQKNIR